MMAAKVGAERMLLWHALVHSLMGWYRRDRAIVRSCGESKEIYCCLMGAKLLFTPSFLL